MKIAFVDRFGLPYDPDTPLRRPLGGSQSAVAYLAPELAARGHDVQLVNAVTPPRTVQGVRCGAVAEVDHGLLAGCDVVVLVNVAQREALDHLRRNMGPGARLVLWTGHAHDQGAIAGLADPGVRALLDGLAMVSDWQRSAFIQTFGIDPERAAVLRNAVSPPFAGLFEGSVAAAKAGPPVLVYTSTPNRGLDRLLVAFERIRARFPDARLKVFSSLVVYNMAGSADPFGSLYLRCQMTPGVEYLGSVAQSALAEALRSATMLAYPNTFPETSSIAVMEAMAAGCMVVTSDLAALPETTRGFADLIPLTLNARAHAEAFAEAAIAALERRARDPAGVAARLDQQVAYVNQAYRWGQRAQEWEAWLTGPGR